MAKKERNTGSVGRARAKRGTSSTSESMNDPVVSSFARSRGPQFMFEVPREFTARNMVGTPVSAAPAVEPTRPVPRPVRGGMKASLVPAPRPSTAKERASADAALRASQREAADRDMGMKYGGKVKKMMGGGTCRGMGKATKGGNYSRG